MNTRNRRRTVSSITGLAYLLPALGTYVLFLLVPLLRTMFVSLFDWDGLQPGKFTGAANYLEILTDRLFAEAVMHNLVLIVFLAVIPAAVGLLLATLLEMNPIRAGKLFETVYFIPQVLSLVVVGVVWKWIYHPLYGLLQVIVSAFGASIPVPLLGDSSTALFAIGFSGTWVNYGFAMMVFLSGFKRIPAELYESASIDGASRYLQWRRISFPLLRNELAIVLTYLLISALKVFDLVFVMTRGGPGTSTTVMSLYVYKNAFQYNRPGYASALAVSMLLVLLAVAVLPNLMRRGEKDEL